MRRDTADGRCGRVAAAQYGVLSVEQSEAEGLSRGARRKRLEDGAWVRVLPSVFRLGGAPESWHQKLMSVLLWAGPEAAVSHRSAAALWALNGFYPVHHEFSVTGTPNKPEGAEWFTLHCGRELGRWDVCVKKRIRVTRPERTLLDLSELLKPDDLEAAIDFALRKKITTPHLLKVCLKRLAAPGRRTGVFQAVLNRRGPTLLPTDSQLEVKFLKLFHERGLPLPEPGLKLLLGARRLDFAWPENMVGVEIESLENHSTKLQWSKDITRLNEIAAEGWRVLRFTHLSLKAPDEVIATLKRALGIDEPVALLLR